MSVRLDFLAAANTDGCTRGDLRTLRLVEIAQLISLGGKTAVVSIRARNESGETWFESGALTHAECGRELSGASAFYHMIGWKDGEFVIEYDVTTNTRSIEGDLMYHLLEGLRRIDETGDPTPAWDPAPSDPIHGRTARSMIALIPLLAILVGVFAWWSAVPTRGLTDSATLPALAEAVTTSEGPAPISEVRLPLPVPGSEGKSGPKADYSLTSKRQTSKKRVAKKPGGISTSGVDYEAVKTTEPPARSVDAIHARALEGAEPSAAPNAVPLGVVIRSSFDAGTLSIIMDGRIVYSVPLRRTAGALRRFFLGSDDGESALNTRLCLSPGSHRLAARVQLEDGSEVQTADITVEGEPGVTRELSVIAGARRTQPIAIELK